MVERLLFKANKTFLTFVTIYWAAESY